MLTDAEQRASTALAACDGVLDPQPGELAALRARCRRLAKVARFAAEMVDSLDPGPDEHPAPAGARVALAALQPGDLDAD